MERSGKWRVAAFTAAALVVAALGVAIVVATLQTQQPAVRLTAPVTDPMVVTTTAVTAPDPTKRANLTVADVSRYTSVPWKFLSLTDDTHLQVEYVAGDGDCVLPKGFAVKYTKRTVEVWALSKTDWSRQACASRLVYGYSILLLTQPLGDRELVHAPTDRNWPASALRQ